LTVAVHVKTLGIVQVENFHLDPGVNPSGKLGVFVTYTGNGEVTPTCTGD
jgi:hypothetical protein